MFALMHLLGFRFAPRIRDLSSARVYVDENASRYPALRSFEQQRFEHVSFIAHGDDETGMDGDSGVGVDAGLGSQVERAAAMTRSSHRFAFA